MGFRQVKFLLVCCVLAFALENSEAFAQSLLKGATPSNFSVPSGWQVYATQGFESGSLNSSLAEFTNNGGGICTVGETFVSPVQVHSGTRSTCQKGHVPGQYNNNGWGFEYYPHSEVYVSFWEYRDSNARFNDEYWLFQIVRQNPFEELIVGWLQGSSGVFNSTHGQKFVISQGAFEQGGNLMGDMTIPVGAWHQWEIHWKANTPGLSDGVVHVYLDGVLAWAKGPTNLNSNVTMTGGRLMLAATYSKSIWRRADNSCAASIGEAGAHVDPAIVCYDYTNCPCAPNPPIFNRYLDDIIVLTPGSGSGGVHLDAPPGPPNPPFGLAIQ